MGVDPQRRPMGVALKYNPHLWSDDELRDIFVVRHEQLRGLLERIRTTPPNVTPQATLLVGARGMGKTTLLRRLALSVREEPELFKHWLPLSFPEEQYTVSSLAELWRNVLDALIDALEQSGAGRDEIAELDRRAREISESTAADQATPALALVVEWCEAHQRRLVLLIDSTDLLLESLRRATSPAAKKSKAHRKSATARGSDDAALWQLRKTLLQSRCLMWIGATYQSLESHHAYDAAFHDFFDLVTLSPLNVQDMRDALLALARRFGMRGSNRPDEAEEAMRRELGARPERLHALRALTGGNPRTTAILYELFAAGPDGDLHGDLRALLDLMTPLYKARMEQLSEQPRKVLAHVMEAWDPMSLREVAAAAGIPSSTVSSQLVRLEQDGLVQKVPLAGTTRSGYQVTERFFNIWFLMRHAARRLRQRLTWLVEFMRLWYRRDELQGIAIQRASVHKQRRPEGLSQVEYSRAVARAIPEGDSVRLQLEYAVYSQARERAEAMNKRVAEAFPDLFDLQGDDQPFQSGEACRTHFLQVKSALEAVPAEPGVDRAAWVLRVLGALEASLSEKHALARATPLLTPAVASRPSMFPRRSLRRQLIEAAFNQQTREAASALLASGDLLPDCADEGFFRRQIASVLHSLPQGEDLGLALFLRCTTRALVLRVATSLERAWASKGELLYLLVLEVWRVDAASAGRLLEIARAIKPMATAPEYCVAGNLLWNHLKRYGEAEAAYRKAISLDETYAQPWDDLGDLLQDRLKRYDEAEAAYRKAISLDETYALPWNNLGNLLRYRLKRYDEAEAAYRKAISLDETDALPWNNLGNLFQHRLKRYDEAEATYRKAISLDETYAQPWVGLGNLLQYRLKRYDEAEAAYRKAISLNETGAGPRLSLGNLLQDRLERLEEAEGQYVSAQELEPDEPMHWVNHARLLARLDRHDEATNSFRHVVALLTSRDFRDRQGEYAQVRLQTHLWLRNLDSAREALEQLADSATRGEADSFYLIREQVFECHRMGIGPRLAELMARSPLADFLSPFAHALLAAESRSLEPMEGISAEVRAVAMEVLGELDPSIKQD